MKWNEITWYSKLATIIFFIGALPALTFCIGRRYQEAVSQAETQIVQVLVKNKDSISTKYFRVLDPGSEHDCGWGPYILNDQGVYFFSRGDVKKLEDSQSEQGEFDWVVLSHGYIENSRHVYLNGEIVKDAEPSTFKVPSNVCGARG